MLSAKGWGFTMEYLAAVHAQGEILARTADTVRVTLAEVDLAPWRAGSLGAVAMGADRKSVV